MDPGASYTRAAPTSYYYNHRTPRHDDACDYYAREHKATHTGKIPCSSAKNSAESPGAPPRAELDGSYNNSGGTKRAKC